MKLNLHPTEVQRITNLLYELSQLPYLPPEILKEIAEIEQLILISKRQQTNFQINDIVRLRQPNNTYKDGKIIGFTDNDFISVNFQTTENRTENLWVKPEEIIFIRR